MSGILGTLSICRKAGKLTGGMDEVKSAVGRNEARLVLVTSDASEKTRSEIEYVCSRKKVKTAALSDTMYDVAEAVGKRFAVMAITDRGFAESVLSKLSGSPDNT